MDVKIKTENCNYKMRVAGLLIKNNKLLTVKICDNEFYCLPGGHVHVGESSRDAMVREFYEEVNVNVSNVKLIALAENFFKNQKKLNVHEVCYFYLIETNDNIEVKDYSYVENDEGELKNMEFKWVDINNIKNFNFRPSLIAEKLSKNNFEFEHFIHSGK